MYTLCTFEFMNHRDVFCTYDSLLMTATCTGHNIDFTLCSTEQFAHCMYTVSLYWTTRYIQWTNREESTEESHHESPALMLDSLQIFVVVSRVHKEESRMDLWRRENYTVKHMQGRIQTSFLGLSIITLLTLALVIINDEDLATTTKTETTLLLWVHKEAKSVAIVTNSLL